MSGHTPGPWFISGSMTKYVEALIAEGMIQEVAAIGPTAADNGYGDQQQANATLIAVAPCLLKAAERYLQFMHHGNCGFGWQFSGVHPETELKNAIARSKGEA